MVSYYTTYNPEGRGAISNRPAPSKFWQATRVRKIDFVLGWKFDRFVRSTKQLIDALEEFYHLGIDLIPITEQIDTSSPMGMFTVISAIAEFKGSSPRESDIGSPRRA
jgi:DNA invertase Pin-like site-specific DNA recombinase